MPCSGNYSTLFGCPLCANSGHFVLGLLPSNFQVVHGAHMLVFDGRVNIVADALIDLSNQFPAIGDMEESFQVSYGWG